MEKLNDNFFEDDSMWIWVILVILLLFNFPIASGVIIS